MWCQLKKIKHLQIYSISGCRNFGIIFWTIDQTILELNFNKTLWYTIRLGCWNAQEGQ
jgi:hypothetical protein